jgi:serine protease Do
MIEGGKIERPYMGISLVNLEEVPSMYLPSLPESVQQGAIITFIDPNSAASKAGLQKQDVIVAINDQEIMASGDIRKYLYSKTKIGDKVTLKLYRDGKLINVSLVLSPNTTNH